MRSNRKNPSHEDSSDSKKNLIRSLSSFNQLTSKSPAKPPVVRKNANTPIPWENLTEESEKTSSQEVPAFDSYICKHCQMPKDYESKILFLLEDILTYFSSIISSYNSWKNCKSEKFSTNANFRNIFPKDSEISRKVLDVQNLCKKSTEILEGLTKDISLLAKTNPWKNATIRKPASSNICATVQETLNKAQKSLTWLKTNTSLNIHENSSDALTRCLQVELQQSLRERRILEAKLLNVGNQSSELVIKTIERIVAENQIELST